MIIFLVSCGHEYTHTSLCGQEDALSVSVLAYDRLFSCRSLAPATYIFTDFDRLSFWELRLAALIYARIAAAGWQPLNDPARVRQRYALLRRLHESGVNQFGVYRIETGEMPKRYPVFLRNECAHKGPLTGLLSGKQELLSAVEDLLAAGHPEHHLLAVEYAAEPVRSNIYRKLAMYRIGERVFPGMGVHDESWMVQTGKKGIAGQKLYDEENALVRQNPYIDQLRSAFEVAQVSYGRADFAVVGGRVQIYEINTNPTVAPLKSHPFPIRLESGRLVWKQYIEALSAIELKLDAGATGDRRVILTDPDLERHQRWWGWSKIRRKTA